MNYNEKYSFSNIECNAHLLGDLQKISDNLKEHEWAEKMKGLINNTYKEREKAISEAKEIFTDEEIENFFKKFNKIVLEGIASNKEEDSYYGNEERKFNKHY